MWANVQSDDHPAEYRWRPLFNAAVWLTPSTRVPCSNAAKTRNPLKLAGVPQANETISAASRPKFTILQGHVGQLLLLNKFFSDCRYVPQLQKYSPTKWCDGAQMAIFWVLHFQRAACSMFQTCILNSHQVTPCVEVWQTSTLRPLRLGEEKRKKEEERNHRAKNIMACLLHNQVVTLFVSPHSVAEKFITTMLFGSVLVAFLLKQNFPGGRKQQHKCARKQKGLPNCSATL